jgi:hypothetical protein
MVPPSRKPNLIKPKLDHDLNAPGTTMHMRRRVVTRVASEPYAVECL